MIQKIAKVLFLSICIGSTLSAQSLLSVQYPDGLPMSHSTGPSLAMGGAGVGVSDDFFGMADNCANLGGATRSVFSAATSIDFSTINDGGRSSSSGAFSPRLFSFAFPISKVGTFAVSFDRRSNLKSGFSQDTALSLPSGQGVFERRTIKTAGGLNSWQAGWGRSLGRWARIGVSYERLYMSSDEFTMDSAVLNGVPSSSGFDSLTRTFRANGIRAGIQVPVKQFTLGLSGEYLFTGDIDWHHGSTEGSSGSGYGSLHLPGMISGGVSYVPSPSWLTAASLSYTLWSNYYSNVTLGALNAPGDAVSFSLGARYIPAPSLLVPRYWEIMQYGAGVHYTQLPAATASESAIALSLGLPISQGGGLFDLIVELGRRTDTRYTNFSENYCQVMVGINGGGKWFQSTATRY
jgi:hypothetical protein